MKEKNMTALVSCFARAYHYQNNLYRIFSDTFAYQILGEEDYVTIASNLGKGIKFFNPKFTGNDEEALRWIVDHQLSPSVLGRSAFCEASLKTAIRLGCKQYLIFASGYDTFAYRNDLGNLKVFELDKAEMIQDKRRRLEVNKMDNTKVNFISCDFREKNWIQSLKSCNYHKNQISFSSLLGISYYLKKKEFSKMLENISSMVCRGSSIVLDYPTYDSSKETKINEKLASGANEEMQSKYTYKEMEDILVEHGFFIYEHLNHEEMTNTYFYSYNTLNPDHQIIAPVGVCYCLAVKR